MKTTHWLVRIAVTTLDILGIPPAAVADCCDAAADAIDSFDYSVAQFKASFAAKRYASQCHVGDVLDGAVCALVLLPPPGEPGVSN